MEINRIHMKTKFYILLSLLIVLFSQSGCQSPEELIPPVAKNGINSITATFEDGTGEFKGLSVEGSDEIVITIPYYFPESSTNQVTEEMLKKMRVNATLDDNVTVEPSLLFMDLTQENRITITDQQKQKREFIVRAEVKKSSEALIEEFSLPAYGLTGVINQNTKTISLVSVDDLGETPASYRLSYHATISPDPATTNLNYDSPVTLTVTAHDGVGTNTYTVEKNIPEKIKEGIRDGSAKIIFAKKLSADLGISAMDLTGGIAATQDYVVLNTRNNNSVYINAKTGEKVGEFSLGDDIKGNLSNFYNTADDKGNILVNNLAPNAGTFKIWKLSSVNSTPTLLIDWKTSGTYQIGRKVSVQGSVDGDAIITAGFHNVSNKFARWTVVGGVLTSHEPEIVTMANYSWSNNNIDVIYSSSNNVNSDYYAIGYSDNRLVRIDGNTHTIKANLDKNDANYIGNAIDYIEFNGGKYVTYNHVNSFTWGTADQVWLLDCNGKFSGAASAAAIWTSEKGKYGPNALGLPVNGNGTGDVALVVSDNGYFMYLYFMFTNGYIVGVQFDCIDM